MSEVIILLSEEGFPSVDFYCSDCDSITEGFSLCLKCNPQTYEVIGMKDDSLSDVYKRYAEMFQIGITPKMKGVRDEIANKNSVEVITGQAPNIPWHKLQNMTDEEIAAENNKHYRIVGIEKALETNVYEREIWNAAIEAALEYVDNFNDRDKIRKLKK